MKAGSALRSCLRDVGGKAGCMVPVYAVSNRSRDRVWCNKTIKQLFWVLVFVSLISSHYFVVLVQYNLEK